MKFNLVTREKKRSSFHVGRNGTSSFLQPVRDWTIGLLSSIALFFTGISFIAYDFYVQFKVPQEAVSAVLEPVVYEEKEVRRYADSFRKKEEVFNELRGVKNGGIATLQENAGE